MRKPVAGFGRGTYTVKARQDDALASVGTHPNSLNDEFGSSDTLDPDGPARSGEIKVAGSTEFLQVNLDGGLTYDLIITPGTLANPLVDLVAGTGMWSAPAHSSPST